jgi:hypothetical protein
VIAAYTVDVPRSRAVPLITRGDRIKSLGIDLARELARQNGQGPGAHAMAAGLKREIDAVLRALKRPKPKATMSGP